MSTQLTNIVLYSLVIVFDIIGLCVTFFIFTMMLLRRSVVKKDGVGYLLTANSFIAFIITSPLITDMCIHSIYGELHPNSSFAGWGCRWKGYAIYITECAYFYSFLLQAIYRFCRIVYPTRVKFQYFRPYAILSVAQWPLAGSLLLPGLLVGDIEYLPHDHHCQFAPTNTRASLVGLSILFIIPFTLTLICYFYTLYRVHTRTTALISINQNASIHRDLIILSRLILLFTFVTIVALPHVLIVIIYAITGYLTSWVVSLEWFLSFFGVAASCFLQLLVSPHLKKNMHWDNSCISCYRTQANCISLIEKNKQENLQ